MNKVSANNKGVLFLYILKKDKVFQATIHLGTVEKPIKKKIQTTNDTPDRK